MKSKVAAKEKDDVDALLEEQEKISARIEIDLTADDDSNATEAVETPIMIGVSHHDINEASDSRRNKRTKINPGDGMQKNKKKEILKIEADRSVTNQLPHPHPNHSKLTSSGVDSALINRSKNASGVSNINLEGAVKRGRGRPRKDNKGKKKQGPKEDKDNNQNSDPRENDNDETAAKKQRYTDPLVDFEVVTAARLVALRDAQVSGEDLRGLIDHV